MKGKFDVYLLQPFKKKVDFLISNMCLRLYDMNFKKG